MTKEKIIETIENKGNMEIDPNGNTWCEIQGEDIFYIANELLALIEQEKREQAREILKMILNLFEKDKNTTEIARLTIKAIGKSFGVEL